MLPFFIRDSSKNIVTKHFFLSIQISFISEFQYLNKLSPIKSMLVHNDKFHFQLTIKLTILIMQLLFIGELLNMLVGHMNAVLILIYK